MKRVLLIISLVFVSCFKQPIYKRSGTQNSVIIVTVNFKSPMLKGYGGSLKLRNVTTNEIFSEQFRRGFYSTIILPNIPLGSYKVEEFVIIAGNLKILLKNHEERFNVINIAEPAIYDLGNYLITKEPPLLKFKIKVNLEPPIDSSKVTSELAEKTNSWTSLRINKSTKLFKRDTDYIAIN